MARDGRRLSPLDAAFLYFERAWGMVLDQLVAYCRDGKLPAWANQK